MNPPADGSLSSRCFKSSDLSSMQRGWYKEGRARFGLHVGFGKRERRSLVRKLPDPFRREGLREAVDDEQESGVPCEEDEAPIFRRAEGEGSLHIVSSSIPGFRQPCFLELVSTRIFLKSRNLKSY